MKLSELGIPVENLAGVGPATAKNFARLNIFTVGDLLQAYPRNYEDRTKTVYLHEFSTQKPNTLCKVISHSWFGYSRMKTLKIAISDGTANAFLVAFNRPFLEKTLPVGSIIHLSGSFHVNYGELQSTTFEASKLSDDGDLKAWQKKGVPSLKVIPIYSLTEGLSQKNYHKAIESALKLYAKTIDNDLDQKIISERKLLSKSESLIKIHMPQTMEDVELARRTLIYEELFFFEYKMAQRALDHRGTLPSLDQSSVFESTPYSTENKIENASSSFTQIPDTKESLANLRKNFENWLSPKQKALLSRLDFELTKDQMQVIISINSDIDKSQLELNSMNNTPEKLERNPFSMSRLLQGDVGSGKTLVSFFAALRTIDYGSQVALLAPTEILARQHAETAARLLEPLGVKTAFLTGNLKAKGREHLVNALKDGSLNLVIGTHALFSRNTQYKNLGLAIIDEQHRFGVAQRESIIAKGRTSFNNFSHSPDLLMMSATPIPQSLALSAFGDLDISVIRTMPSGRLPVKTYITPVENEAPIYNAVRKELNLGHQAYFVYPRIGNSDENDFDENNDKNLKSAEEMFSFLSTKVFPDYKCAIVHGKVDEEKQREILEKFQSGEIKILCATTVVEVGVDVAKATCITIEHADRFGLAELHQLRGRVGRSNLQSYCFLTFGKNITEAGKDRLRAIYNSNDGFVIAEEDLRLRGPGEISGTNQSGYLKLSIADLARDKEVLKAARYDAFNLIKNN